jgi:predicted transcriptional regulator
MQNQERTMENQKTSGEIDRHLVATIVSSYIKHNSIAANDLPTVIASVQQSLSHLGKSSPPVEVPTPAVSIRRSVTPDYVVCLECGFRSQTLRRHLRVQHGLEVAAYYARERRRAVPLATCRRRPNPSSLAIAERRAEYAGAVIGWLAGSIGIIAHSSNLVEHPELVAERIVRFAGVVGRENVIAGADCGFASSATTCEVHPLAGSARSRTRMR